MQAPADASALAWMVGTIISDLAASGEGSGQPTLFFPDGVQSIRARLAIGPGGDSSAELELAGPGMGTHRAPRAGPLLAPEPDGRLETAIDEETAGRAPRRTRSADRTRSPGKRRPAAAAARERSGAQWVARFPGSRSTADLKAGFRQASEAFIGAMKAAGATVRLSATYRPPERAYLMHHAWAISRLGANPIPPMSGVDIEWDHGDRATSKRAAEDMVQGYGLSVQAVLNSRHTERRAIDMSIAWSGTLSLRNGNGGTTAIATSPRDGQNAELHRVGRSFGVFKLASDPPHWSDDGH